MRYLHRLPSDFKTLEIAVQNAGSAWGCAFASSAEYEAATIQAKRAAGVYGLKRRRRQLLVTVAAVTLLAVCILQLF
jgi:hypothetical protein